MKVLSGTVNGGNQTLPMDGVLEERIRRGVSWMREASGARLSRRGVGWMCWSRRRRAVKEEGVLWCSAGRRCW